MKIGGSKKKEERKSSYLWRHSNWANYYLLLRACIFITIHSQVFETSNQTNFFGWRSNVNSHLITPAELQGNVEAFKVKKVDTTGAGDSFVGALLHKLIDDNSIIEVNTSIRSSKPHPNQSDHSDD